MHYTGIIYRPPFEADSLLLQVTSGCSHNKCTFCTMYQDVPFKVSPMEEIIEDLKEMVPYKSVINRVFLEGGDAFALSGEKLIEIAEKIHEYLPKVKKIAAYSNINNIKSKTDEELRRLHELGFDDLNIGLESGDDKALDHMNKGYTAAEAEHEMMRLNNAGIRFGVNIIYGISGRERSTENARLTAELLNRVKPYLIFTGTIHAAEGCGLYEEMKEGTFVEPTIGEYLEEEELFIKTLSLEGVTYFGIHPSNILPKQGKLPGDRDKFLSAIEMVKNKLPKDIMNQIPRRGDEGAALY